MVRKTAPLVAATALSASAEVFFKDSFESLDKWTTSEWKSSTEMGKFELKAGKWAESDNLSLATQTDARFYGSSASFKSFSNKGKDLIVQYTAKYDKDVECGGGYVKLGPKMADGGTKFGDPTPYNIMFGPDKCGYTKRTHLIFSYKGKNVLKKTDLPYKQKEDGLTTLYQLTVSKDNTVKVDVDGENVYSGSIEADWELLPAKEINDPEDTKPSDWVDDAMMDDPEDKKPADWVEEKQVVDEKAKQPEDWDAEEDGEWEAPMIDNPAYKGEWKPKRISNPAYKGIWEPKKISNPDYPTDPDAAKSLYAYEDFGFIGFDLWQVKAGSFFDNVLITDDAKEAEKGLEAYKKIAEVEKAALEEEKSTTTTTTTEGPEDADETDKDDDEDL